MALNPEMFAAQAANRDGRTGDRLDTCESLRCLTQEQDYFARCMGEEFLELLRSAGAPDGLKLASISWIMANLVFHQFVEIIPAEGRIARAVATPAGRAAPALRPALGLPPLEPWMH
jgi:hypothetical protein